MIKPLMRVHRRLAWGVFASLFLALGHAYAEDDLDDGDITEALGGPPSKAFFEVIFINGRATDSDKARTQARLTGEKLGNGVRLIYNDLTLVGVDDIAAAWDKMFNADVSLNAATDTLIARIRDVTESGNEIYIVAYSGGTIVTMNAVKKVASVFKKKVSVENRRILLSRIHVLLVGQAVFSNEHPFSDKWPKDLGSVFELFHKKDGIAQFAGPADWGESSDAAHNYVNGYLPHVVPEMLRSSGRKQLE